MKLLKERILKDGILIGDDILKVDSFINHQMDIELFNEMGKEFKKRFKDEEVTKILTIEASGIGIAAVVAQYFNVPVVFAKKHLGVNTDKDNYESDVYSFTKKKLYKIRVSKRFLDKEDKILIIDDFLANGRAVLGLLDIIEQAGAKATGVGITIEKSFQPGRKLILEKGVHLESLARVKKMGNGTIEFE